MSRNTTNNVFKEFSIWFGSWLFILVCLFVCGVTSLQITENVFGHPGSIAKALFWLALFTGTVMLINRPMTFVLDKFVNRLN